jgi:hypothetical protein
MLVGLASLLTFRQAADEGSAPVIVDIVEAFHRPKLYRRGYRWAVATP